MEPGIPPSKRLPVEEKPGTILDAALELLLYGCIYRDQRTSGGTGIQSSGLGPATMILPSVIFRK
jgi:hypothetical protein